MSYDILFVRAGDVPDKLSAARYLADTEFDEETESVPSREADDRRRRLAADLVKLHPSMKYETTDDDESLGGWVSADDDTCPFPMVELGVDSGTVSISYSADAQALQALAPVIDVFAEHGYVAYDPQTDSILDSTGIPSAQARFVGTQSAVVTQLEARGEAIIPAAPSRPWWKFW
jgi:hypothetical protein